MTFVAGHALLDLAVDNKLPCAVADARIFVAGVVEGEEFAEIAGRSLVTAVCHQDIVFALETVGCESDLQRINAIARSDTADCDGYVSQSLKFFSGCVIIPFRCSDIISVA